MSAFLAAAGGLLSQLNVWDTAAFSGLNALHSPAWDAIMARVSSPWVLVPVHLLLLVVLFRRTGWRSRAALLGLLLLGVGIDLAGAHVIKDGVARVRPCNEPQLAATMHFVGGHRSGAYSFVSTHTAYAFALAAFALFSLHHRRLALGLAIWAAAVGYSRLYVGLHYPGDILGGAAWGVAAAALAQGLAILARRIPWHQPRLADALAEEVGAELQPALAKATGSARVAAHS